MTKLSRGLTNNLNRMLSYLDHCFRIAPGKAGRVERVTLYFLLAGGYNFLTYIPFFFYLKNWPVTAGLLIGVLACWGSLSLIRVGQTRRAAWIAIVGSYFALTFNSIWLGGVFSINDLYIIPVAMVGWLVFGRRLGLRLAMFCALSSILVFLVHTQVGSIFSWPVQQGGLVHAAMTVAFKISLMFIVFALIFVFHYFLTDALETTEKLNATMSAILSSDVPIALAIFDEKLQLMPGSSSAYFQEKFGDCDLKSLVEEFSLSNKSTVISAIELLIGQNLLAWDMNVGNLPEQTTLRGERHHLQWRPIVVHDVVSGILFSANNIESVLQAQAFAAHKDKQAHLLAHLVSLGPAKVCDFVERARFQWNEARRYANLGERRQLFITLHTLKGAARTLGFADLAEHVHELESRVDELMANDFGEVDQHIAEIESCILDLGYSSELLVVPRRSAREAVMASRAQQFLKDLSFPTVERLVQSFEPELAKTARKLGKHPPTLRLNSEAGPTYVSDAVEDALKVVFIHAFRNTLDHGLESPEERRRRGKTETPQIFISIQKADERIVMKVKDDGRGVNLADVRAKAELQGMKPKSEREEDVLELIFAPGFSTRTQVTDISGRGIGMDAIRTHMEKVGGTASLSYVGEGFELCLTFPHSTSLDRSLAS